MNIKNKFQIIANILQLRRCDGSNSVPFYLYYDYLYIIVIRNPGVKSQSALYVIHIIDIHTGL